MIEDIVSRPDDALSSVLLKMKLQASVNVALDAAKDWAIDFPAYEGFTLNVMQKGECWLSIEGKSDRVRLRAGDCFLLTGGKIFTLASDLALKERFPAKLIFTDAKRGLATCNGGGEVFVLGTIFRFEGHLPPVLFRNLPPVIHIDGGSDQAAVLRWSLDRYSAELRGNGVGRSLILTHLAPIMLLQTLRVYLASAPRGESWLVALSDPRLSRVIEAMQSDYQHDWSVDELARLAGMSRSGFALTFRKKVGIPPMDYLMNWRMQIACELLQAGNTSLAAIASAVGYGSESAFSVAFTKILECRPGMYRRRISR